MNGIFFLRLATKSGIMRKFTLLIVFAINCFFASAQTSPSIITGKIIDSSGSPVAGASVQVTGKTDRNSGRLAGQFQDRRQQGRRAAYFRAEFFAG
jgi:hypothetical protein